MIADREMGQFALGLFKALLRCRTINYGDGDCSEQAAVDVIKAVFEAEGIPFVVVAMVEGRPNIVARLAASDPAPGTPGALLLSAHLDVVPAPVDDWADQGWEQDPFGAVERDGWIYGRGAIDMKNMAAMSIAIMVFLHRRRVPLARDLIFAGVADEEDGSHFGTEFLVREHPDLIAADIMFTELGGFPFYFGDQIFYPIQIAEKSQANVEITAYGTGGHGSMLHDDNVIGWLGQAAHALVTRRLPLRVTPQGRVNFETMAATASFTARWALYGLLHGCTHDLIVDYVLPTEVARSTTPMLHNTAVPTVIRAGHKVNQVPHLASLNVDCRILPGCDVDEVIEEIRQLIGVEHFAPRPGSDQPRFRIRSVKAATYAKVQDPYHPEIARVMQLLGDVLNDHGPPGPIFPMLCPGATDAKFYSRHPSGMHCFGFAPVLIPKGTKFTTLFHGVNERIPVDGFLWGLGVLDDAVRRLCAVPIA